MTPFTTVTGSAVPYLQDNIDTDVIIRIERLTDLAREDLGRYAFEAIRHRSDGSLDTDCPFNQPKFLNAPVLLGGRNFGCGSSREGAVWALQGMGVRCVIAPSFGDIFFGNCFQNGVLPLCLSVQDIEELSLQCRDGATVTVDLQACTLTRPDGRILHFEIESLRRQALLAGLDDIGLTLRDDRLIRAWQTHDRLARPWVWAIECALRRSAGK